MYKLCSWSWGGLFCLHAVFPEALRKVATFLVLLPVLHQQAAQQSNSWVISIESLKSNRGRQVTGGCLIFPLRKYTPYYSSGLDDVLKTVYIFSQTEMIFSIYLLADSSSDNIVWPVLQWGERGCVAYAGWHTGQACWSWILTFI